MIKKINAVVYEVNVDGKPKRLHAINMKPGVRADKAPKNSRLELEAGTVDN